jgi:lipoprotein-anchoring transpeptidase ErfK/SrfK
MPIALRRWLLLAFLAVSPIVAAIVSGPQFLTRLHFRDPPIRLKVDLSEREMHVLRGGEVVRSYSVAVGTRKHPTPTGRFWTGRIVWNPRWIPPESDWARKYKPREPGDPLNPMQGVKIYFREPAYFIHGTNDPESIGSAASHGCIRMHEDDAVSLANMISNHRSVLLIIQR